jgi:hypothetical protein
VIAVIAVIEKSLPPMDADERGSENRRDQKRKSHHGGTEARKGKQNPGLAVITALTLSFYVASCPLWLSFPDP